MPTATTGTVESEALALLRELAGPDASFREHQLEAVQDLVEARRRVLCVQRTGWGKSAVYFLATALLRRRGAGPTVLISPLLALMRNQIAGAQRLGIRSGTVNWSNCGGWGAGAGGGGGSPRGGARSRPAHAARPPDRGGSSPPASRRRATPCPLRRRRESPTAPSRASGRRRRSRWDRTRGSPPR